MAFILWILATFISIFALGAKTGFSFFTGHILLSLIALYGLKNISKTFIPWTLLALVYLGASYPRFSIEYFLITLGMIGLAMDPLWLEASFKRRRNILLAFFGLFLISNLLNIGLSELGSLVLWLPVFLVLYFEKINKKNSLIYIISGSLLFLVKKKAAFLAFILTLKNKYLYLTGIIATIASFFFLESFSHFYKVSFFPRLNFWKNILEASTHKPLLGHGFGTFPLSFHIYKDFSDHFGTKANQFLTHAHSTVLNHIFELGLLGLLIVVIFSYLVYLNNKKVFLVFLFIIFVDASINSFSQYLLVSILFTPFIKDFGIFSKLLTKFNPVVSKLSCIAMLSIGALIFSPSIIGHYYFSKADYDKAISWDPQNSYYYFLRGAINLKKDLRKSEEDLKKAVELSPTSPIFHGFLAASQLGLNKLYKANRNLDLAIKTDGEIAYWYLIKSYANADNEELSKQYLQTAITIDPQIKAFIKESGDIPKIIPSKRTKGNFQSNFFYRWGPEVDFPIPIRTRV
jgi:hypothetical protein